MSAYESAPMSNLAELSLIKIAQIYFSQSKFSDAIKTMELLLDKYKETIYGDLALITIANSYLAEGNYDNAIEKYTDLLSKYPRSIYLEEARNKIRIIRDRLN
jgi:outer membrane protein assembly factor BamD (BamD/ComL family)